MLCLIPNVISQSVEKMEHRFYNSCFNTVVGQAY